MRASRRASSLAGQSADVDACGSVVCFHVPGKKKPSALSRALAMCRKIRSRHKRTKCEAAAKQRYHVAKKQR
jgi:hypothetical protein